MNNGLKIGLSFTLGAVAGVAASWFILKKRYEQIADDEIASFKEEYKERVEKRKEAAERLDRMADALKDAAERVESKAKVDEIIKKEGYADINEEGESGNRKKPYVIRPDELGDEQYSICVLTYYADGVLTNDYHEVIDDVEGTVGKDSLETFGEFEEDAVYVRNDELEIDYEINRNLRRFVDIGPDDNEYDE